MKYLTIKDLAKRYNQSVPRLLKNLEVKTYVKKYVISRDINNKVHNSCYVPTKDSENRGLIKKLTGSRGNRGVWWYKVEFFDKIFTPIN